MLVYTGTAVNKIASSVFHAFQLFRSFTAADKAIECAFSNSHLFVSLTCVFLLSGLTVHAELGDSGLQAVLGPFTTAVIVPVQNSSRDKNRTRSEQSVMRL